MNIEKELKEISLKVKEFTKDESLFSRECQINDHKVYKNKDLNIIIVKEFYGGWVDYSTVYLSEDNIHLNPTVVLVDLGTCYCITRIYNINKYGAKVSILFKTDSENLTEAQCRLDFQTYTGNVITKFIDTDLDASYISDYTMFNKTDNLDTISNVTDTVIEVVLALYSDEIEYVSWNLMQREADPYENGRICRFFESEVMHFRKDMYVLESNNGFISEAYIKGIGNIEFDFLSSIASRKESTLYYSSDKYNVIISKAKDYFDIMMQGDNIHINFNGYDNLFIYAKDDDGKINIYRISSPFVIKTVLNKLEDIFSPIFKILNKYTQEEIKNAIR